MSTATTTNQAPRKRSWWKVLLVILGGLLVIALIAAGLWWFFGQPKDTLDPNATPADCSQVEAEAVAAGVTIPHFFNLDVGTNVFGPDPGVRDEAGLLLHNHNDRCMDPARTSAHAVAWGLIPAAQVNAYTAKFVVDRAMWLRAIGQMEQLEKESMDYATSQGTAFALQPVPADVATLYMQPDGNGGVQVLLGATHTEGSGMVFTHPDGRKVTLRVECDMQPVFDVPPPGIPECEDGTNCMPEVCPYNPELPPYSEDCLQPKDETLSVNNGWTPLPSGDLTSDDVSETQQESGDVSGNVTDNQVSSDTTTDSVTSDLPAGTLESEGAQDGGGEDRSNDVVDTTMTNPDVGGTDGDGSIGGPPED